MLRKVLQLYFPLPGEWMLRGKHHKHLIMRTAQDFQVGVGHIAPGDSDIDLFGTNTRGHPACNCILDDE